MGRPRHDAAREAVIDVRDVHLDLDLDPTVDVDGKGARTSLAGKSPGYPTVVV
jgi:hypothetical protein